MRKGKGSPAATRNLPLHEVESGDHLRDWMFDLQARIHLHEVKAAIAIEQELDRPGAHIAHRARSTARRLAQGCAACRGDQRRWRFFDDLLMAALHRQSRSKRLIDIAMRVPEYLHLDVARRDEIFLDQHGIVAKGSGQPRACRLPARRAKSARASTRRMPLPPPPALALIMTG